MKARRQLTTKERANRSALLAFIGIPLVGNAWILVQILWPDVVFLTIHSASKPPFQWMLHAFVWTIGTKLSAVLLAWSAYINPGRQYVYIWLAAALYFVLESVESLMTGPGYAKELMAPGYMLLCYLAFYLAPKHPPNEEQH